MLQELAAHILTTNTANVFKRTIGDSGKRSIWSWKLSRNVSNQVNGEIQRAPDWEGPKFCFTHLKRQVCNGAFGVLSLKDKKRLTKSLPSKGGEIPKLLKVKKSDKSQRKRDTKCVQRNGNLSRSTTRDRLRSDSS